jgi:hypothetical protein
MYLWAIYHDWSTCGPIMRIYQSLKDTWMWKLGTRPRSFFTGNKLIRSCLRCAYSFFGFFQSAPLFPLPTGLLRQNREHQIILFFVISGSSSSYYSKVCFTFFPLLWGGCHGIIHKSSLYHKSMPVPIQLAQTYIHDSFVQIRIFKKSSILKSGSCQLFRSSGRSIQ